MMAVSKVATRRASLVLVVPVGLLLSGLLVWQASHAAFSDTAANPGNSWAAGEVTITDDRVGTAMFDAPNLQPGDSGEQCLVVTYEGSLDADVRLYGAYVAAQDGLAPYLDVTAEQGTGAAADCTDFAGGSVLYGPATLGGFVGTHASFASGLDTWAPTGDSSATRTYRFAFALPEDVSNDAQGQATEVTFTWEAQSR